MICLCALAPSSPPEYDPHPWVSALPLKSRGGLQTWNELVSLLSPGMKSPEIMTTFAINMLLASNAVNSKIPFSMETILRICTIAICIYEFVSYFLVDRVVLKHLLAMFVPSQQSINFGRTEVHRYALSMSLTLFSSCPEINPLVFGSLVLFVLIRYISMAMVVVSNVGYFSLSFTPESCRRYYMIAVVLKGVSSHRLVDTVTDVLIVLQASVCQFVLALRTYSISRRSERVKIFLIVFTLIITILEWFTNLYGRVMIQRNRK